MDVYECLKGIAQQGLGPDPVEEDGLAVMLLLHTYAFELSVPLSERPGVTGIEALTQRSSAEAVAAAWPDQRDVSRVNPFHWYWQFNMVTPFEVIEDVPPEWAERINNVAARVLAGGLVRSVRPED